MESQFGLRLLERLIGVDNSQHVQVILGVLVSFDLILESARHDEAFANERRLCNHRNHR
jgi:hypothetical protein